MVETKVDKTTKGRASGGVHKRPNFPTAFKRQLVEQTFEPGASVALIARRNDVNANLLFKWRRQYRKGAYGAPALAEQAAPVPDAPTRLLPVSVIADTPTIPIETPVPFADPMCEIEFEHARVRIHGDVSPAMLQLILRELRR